MKKKIRIILMVFCLCIFCFSLYKVIDYFYGTYQTNRLVKELHSQIKPDAGKTMTFKEKYETLLKENSDMIGWIKIEDTVIDYPVMLTPNNEEYYLRLDFNKEYSWRGTPFLNKEADIENISDNMIIYAHNMDDGTMFHDLEKFRDVNFYQEHKTFTFDTIYHNGTYEIVAIFKTVDDPSHELYIDYYRFFNIQDETVFNQQIQKYKQMAFYDTGVTPEFGDKLLTLSTCEYSNKNGRLVLVARKVEEK